MLLIQYNLACTPAYHPAPAAMVASTAAPGYPQGHAHDGTYVPLIQFQYLFIVLIYNCFSSPFYSLLYMHF